MTDSADGGRTGDRISQIEHRLRSVIDSNADIQIKDQGHLHAGHAGAASGLGHFDLVIISRKFDGIGSLQRHQMVYHALGDLMESDIHAVRIKARSPSE